MVTYNVRMDWIAYPDLDNISSYVSRSQSCAQIGRALGQVYLKLDNIPELSEYIDREMTELSKYHSEDLTKVREHFQHEMFRLLKHKPADPSKIFLKAYINGTNRDQMTLRFSVDYGPDRNETIKITDDNINDYFDLLFRFRQDRVRSYHDAEAQVYSILDDDYYLKGNLFPDVEKYDGTFPGSCRNFTFQVSEDCNCRCSYCFPAGTQVTMEDLSLKNIESLIVGDKVLGFDEYSELNKPRRFKSTEVTCTFKRKSKCVKIDSLKFDQPMIVTPEHPILTQRGFIEAGNLRPRDTIYKCPSIEYVESIDTTDIQYQTGYFIAAWLGDGCVLDRNDCSDGYHRYFMRFVVKDDEMMDRMREFSKNIGFDFMDYPFKLSDANTKNAIRSNKKVDYEKFQSILLTNLSKNVLNRDRSFMAGYIAGLFDAEGSNDGKTIRFTNTDLFLLYWAQESLSELGFEYTMDKLSPTVNKIKTSIRIVGGNLENIRFFRTVQPAITRKGLQNNIVHLEYRLLTGVEISELDQEYEVYNIETDCHTFIANDILVHNCYQTCKSNKKVMDFQTACSAIDDLLAGNFEYLSPGFSKSIILDFIGGDPLLEIELIGEIYEYFLQEAYRLNHPWFHHHRISMCSNGLLYFNKKTKEFFDKYARMTSFNISIDGNKALHDACRIQPTGEGSYDVGIAGVLHAHKAYRIDISSKMTLAPSNIPYIKESVKNLCIDNPYPGINLNVVFEDVWSNHDAKVLYDQMKAIADMVIEYKRPDLYFSIFRTAPVMREKETSDSLTNVCGGAGAMLAVGPDKNYYPCIRYMPSSLNGEAKELIIGNTDSKMDTETNILREFPRITYMSQQNDYCLSCPLHHMCNWCTAFCLQANGTANERTTFICEMIKAEYLASIYYWAKLAIHYPEYHIQLDPELAPYYHFEQIVPKEEYDMLENLIWQFYLDEHGEVDEDRIAKTLEFMKMSAPLAEATVTYQSGTTPGASGSYSGGDQTFPLIVGLHGAQTDRIPGGSIRGMKAFCTQWGVDPGTSYTASGPYTDSEMIGYLIAGESNRKGAQFSIWALSGYAYFPSQCISGSGGGDEYVFWRWNGNGQSFATLDKIIGSTPPEDPEEPAEGECGTCNDTCTDSCSEAGDCKHACMSQCRVLCDNTCDRVCIQRCNDHCDSSCEEACSGCDNVCTACNWSCQNACIVTCQNECAACRQNCKNLGMSNTECRLLCRACTTMCIMNCSQSCITWNSGGTVSGKVRSNATLNDWQGFTSNNAPRNGAYHLSPGGSHAYNWTTTVNLFPKKTNVPYGYGLAYNGQTPAISGLGSINGERGDWDAGSLEGEASWSHIADRDQQDGSHRFQDDLDYDKKNGL